MSEPWKTAFRVLICQKSQYLGDVDQGLGYRDLERIQSIRAPVQILKGGFSLRKNPLEGGASRYIYSDSAIVAMAPKPR
jgi:hypothetical protein